MLLGARCVSTIETPLGYDSPIITRQRLPNWNRSCSGPRPQRFELRFGHVMHARQVIAHEAAPIVHVQQFRVVVRRGQCGGAPGQVQFVGRSGEAPFRADGFPAHHQAQFVGRPPIDPGHAGLRHGVARAVFRARVHDDVTPLRVQRNLIVHRAMNRRTG